VYKNQKRRKYKRIEKPYMTRFQVKQYKGLEISSAEWDMVALKDLSAGGVFFYSSKNLGIDSLLDLKIDVSADSPPIKCVGIVLRVKKQQDTSIFGIAAAFMEIGAQDKEMINKTAAEISRQEKRTPMKLL
jgi:c-di-GMP-binding flagellar brake protein YcgR